MRLVEWVGDSSLSSFDRENESLDIFLQIIRLLRESGKGQGIISPVLYDVDSANNVNIDDGWDNLSGSDGESLCREFKPPENEKSPGFSVEKGDVFSLGLLLYYLLEREVCKVDRPAFSAFPFKPRRKSLEISAVKARESKPIPMLMERMTSYEAEFRPSLKEVESVLSSDICRFGILLENAMTGERHSEITRSFTGSASYKFTPESEYVVDLSTLAPVSVEPMLIPYRLVKKQYVLPVVYSAKGRWDNVAKKEGFEEIQAGINQGDVSDIPKSMAALCFCDSVYGVEGDSLFCETDGLAYEMGFYEYSRGDKSKKISIVREGEVAVPERLEARMLSILKERSKTICDLYCVGVYGSLGSAVIKAINDMLPEAVRIYRLDDDDLLKGAMLLKKSKIEIPKEAVAK